MNHTTVRSRWALIGLLVLFSLASTVVRAEADNSVHARAQALNATWNAAFNSGDPAAVAALYADEAMLSPGNGEVLNGREQIEGLFRSFIDNGVHDHSIEVIDVYQDGDILYQVSTWQAYGAKQDDGARPVFGGILVNILHRDDGGEWKSRVHVWNTSS